MAYRSCIGTFKPVQVWQSASKLMCLSTRSITYELGNSQIFRVMAESESGYGMRLTKKPTGQRFSVMGTIC